MQGECRQVVVVRVVLDQAQLGVRKRQQQRVSVGSGQPDSLNRLDPTKQRPGADTFQLQLGGTAAYILSLEDKDLD